MCSCDQENFLVVEPDVVTLGISLIFVFGTFTHDIAGKVEIPVLGFASQVFSSQVLIRRDM